MRKAAQAPRERKVRKAHKAAQAPRERKAPKGARARRVARDRKGPKELKVLQGVDGCVRRPSRIDRRKQRRNLHR